MVNTIYLAYLHTHSELTKLAGRPSTILCNYVVQEQGPETQTYKVIGTRREMNLSASCLFWSDTYDTSPLVISITLAMSNSVAFVPQLLQQLWQQHAEAEGTQGSLSLSLENDSRSRNRDEIANSYCRIPVKFYELNCVSLQSNHRFRTCVYFQNATTSVCIALWALSEHLSAQQYMAEPIQTNGGLQLKAGGTFWSVCSVTVEPYTSVGSLSLYDWLQNRNKLIWTFNRLALWWMQCRQEWAVSAEPNSRPEFTQTHTHEHS